MAVVAQLASAQMELLDDRWVQVQTEHFTLVSQASSRQTTNFADELETWRQVAAFIIADQAPFPKARVPNYVYLLDDTEGFQQFASGEETAFFYPSPRANFMALVADDEKSITAAFHHYVHFLVRNYSDLRVPRWYEEGLAGYLSRFQVDRGRVEFPPYSQQDHELMAALSDSLSMDRLLYRDAALASPRLIQIANLKSESLLYFLLHAHEEDQFVDRRPQLQGYLDLLIEGRNPRFAYDRSFDLTTVQLEAAFVNYLRSTSRPEATIDYGPLIASPDYDAEPLEPGQIAELLGELALNSGRSENAQLFFQAALDSGSESKMVMPSGTKVPMVWSFPVVLDSAVPVLPCRKPILKLPTTMSKSS